MVEMMMVTGMGMEMEGEVVGDGGEVKGDKGEGTPAHTVGPPCPVVSALTNSWQCSPTLWRDPHPVHPLALPPPQARVPLCPGPGPALTSLVGVTALAFSREEPGWVWCMFQGSGYLPSGTSRGR